MKTQITCPECHHEFDIENAIAHDIEKRLKAQFLLKEKEAREQLKQKELSLEQQKNELLREKEEADRVLKAKLDQQLKAKLQEKELELKQKLAIESEEQFKILNQELNEKSEKLKELNKSKAEIERLKREKNEMEQHIKAEQEKQFNQKLKAERAKIIQAAEEANEMKYRELQKKLDDQKKLTEEMKKKQEQGSMQLQGEVQELAIEEWLRNTFALDTIEEIRKGANGADCIQIVNDREFINCGVIYYESKRTKNFNNKWIEKFKNDIRANNANVGVLVTEAMPNGMQRMGMIDGVWVCSFNEFKGLSQVLRQHIITLHRAMISQENKGDKMVMLYDYLTSNSFKLQVEGIVEGFTAMQTGLDKEKKAMQRIWSQREKQIDKVIQNTIHMYGSIKGIAGNAVHDIPSLDFEAEVNEN